MAENVNLIKDFLKVDEADFPMEAALGDGEFERGGRGTVAATGVKEDNVDFHRGLQDLV